MLDRLPRRIIRAVCEYATLELDCIQNRLLINGNPVFLDPQSPAETYLREIESLWNAPFSEYAQADGATCKEALDVLEVIERAQHSSLSDSSPKL
ncbi:MAG: hypothetical protein EBS01_14575 [Verrucomicrobia bacterium]|nr:hypothetical protein [Verrucomicrobiota bacterium]